MTKAEAFAMQYGYYDKEKKHICCVGYNAGYKQAKKDLIDRLAEFYPTLDYTFRSYMLQAFPELKGKIEHYD